MNDDLCCTHEFDGMYRLVGRDGCPIKKPCNFRVANGLGRKCDSSHKHLVLDVDRDADCRLFHSAQHCRSFPERHQFCWQQGVESYVLRSLALA